METKPKGKTTQNSIISDNRKLNPKVKQHKIALAQTMETKPKGKTTQNSISSDNRN